MSLRLRAQSAEIRTCAVTSHRAVDPEGRPRALHPKQIHTRILDFIGPFEDFEL